MKQAKNAVERHVLWSDIHLDLDDWRDFLMENYPELPEDKLYEKMHELNAEYLDDERRNLDIQFSQPILVIGDLGFWNGRAQGYKMIKSGNIRDCLYSDTDMTEWYVDKNGDLRADAIHHDGTNHYLYRVFKRGVTDAQIENLQDKIYCQRATRTDIRESRSGLATALHPSMDFGFQSSEPGSVTRGKTGHAEMHLTVRRILKTKGMRFSLQTYHIPDILWIENTGGGSMQIRASTALRNEYLQISQLAKVSGEPIYITNKGEADLVIQSIEAYEQREKMLAHRASVLEAELDRLSGAPTYSPEQARGRMKEIFDAARVSD